jgi:hypothetical protein
MLLWITAGGAAQGGDLKASYPSLAAQAETDVRVLLNGSLSPPGQLLSSFNSAAALGHFSSEIAYPFNYYPGDSTVAAFTYKFDPNMNIFEHSSLSERGQTTGAGKLNFALGYSGTDHDEFLGQRLNSYNLTTGGGSAIALTPVTENVSGSIAWEKSGSFGRSQLWFPAVDVPGVQSVRRSHWDLEGQHARCGAPKRYARFQDRERDRQTQPGNCGALPPDLAQGERLGGRLDQPGHRSSVQTRGRAETSGIGDLVLRAKTNFFDDEYGALASRLDFYLPTAGADNLRGLGHPAAGASLLYSAALGHFSSHASVSLVWRFDTQQINFLHFALGGDARIAPWLTATADVSLDKNTAQDNVANAVLSLATGIKVNPWRRVVLSSKLLWRPNDQGLRAPFIPSVAIELTFR